jgi:dTDP-4-amino-4,6-dideoxygalactose transaminase
LPPSATPVRLSDLAAGLAAVPSARATAAFATDLAAMMGGPPLHLTASGRAAFFLILEACKRQRPGRNEVVLPAYTCPVLAYAAQAAGLRVRLVDMEPQTLDYDRAALARAIGPQTLAVVSVHPLGLPRPLDDVRAHAHAAGAFFVDDAAQAFGATITTPANAPLGADPPVANLPRPHSEFRIQYSLFVGLCGDAGLFSFGPGKPLSLGGGGAALFNDAALAATAAQIFAAWPRPRAASQLLAWARMAALAAAFHPRGWWWVARLGLNAAGDDPRTWHFARRPLSAPAAALGTRLLPRLPGWNEQRRVHAQRLLAELPAHSGLAPIAVPPGARPIYVRLPLLARDQAQRDELVMRLRRAGIGAGRLYGQTLAEGSHAAAGGDFPGATGLAQRLLTLPTHPYVQEEDIEAMLSVLRTVARL